MLGILAVMVAFMACLTVGTASAADPTYVYSDITTDTWWNDTGAPVILNQSIVVEEGATLTIGPNVTVLADPGVILKVNGTLIAQGNETHKVTFSVNQTLTQWGGIVMNPTGALTFNNVRIDNATTALAVTDAALTLSNTGFYDCYDGVMVTYTNVSKDVSITDCYFENIRQDSAYSYAIYLDIEAYAFGEDTTTVYNNITICNNEFVDSGTWEAVYVDRYGEGNNNGTVAMNGEVVISDNLFDMSEFYWYGWWYPYTDAVYIYEEVYTYDNSTATMNGAITVDNNEFTGEYDDAIYICQYVYALYWNSTAAMTMPVTVTNNIIGGDPADYQGYGIDIYAYAESNDWGVASVTGDVNVAFNEISNVDYDAIYVYFDAYAYDDGATSVTRDLTVCTNVITSVDGYGIEYYAYAYAYDNSSVSIFSDVSVHENTVFESDSDAIYIYQYAYSEDAAAASVVGSLAINNNTLTTLDEGIYVEREIDTEYLAQYENNTAEIVGDVEILGNVIYGENTDDYPIYVYYYLYTEWYGIGTIDGAILIQGNEVLDSYEYAYYVDVYVYAYDYSVATLDSPVCIDDNLATNADIGVYYYFDVYGYDFAVVEVNAPLAITNNDIEAEDDEGIYGYVYVYAADEAYVAVDMTQTITGNTIETETYEGIYLDVYVEAYDNNATALLTGDITITDNKITAEGDDGIYVYIYIDTAPNYDYAVTQAILDGDLIISGNDIEFAGGYEGIYIDLEVYAYTEYESDAIAQFGNVLITENIIADFGVGTESYAIGWYIDVYAEADDYGQDASVAMGDFVVTDNIITLNYDDAYGIYAEWDDIYADGYYANASVSIGQYLIQDNVITCLGEDSYGMYFYQDDDYWYAYAYSEVFATVTIGGISVLDNIVTMTGGDGVYGIYVDYIYNYAEAYYDWSEATFICPIEISGNLVTVDGDDSSGIYIYDYELYAYADEGYAYLEGQLTVSMNTVFVTGENSFGIYVDYDDVDASVSGLDVDEYGTSTIIGDLAVCDNVVNGDMQYGIELDYIDEDVNAVVLDNVVKGSEYGLYLYYCYNVFVSGNLLTYNEYGMYVDYGDMVVIEDNIFTYNTEYGLYLYSVGGTYTVVGNNTFSQNWETGLHMYDCENLTIYNGVYTDNGDYGLYLATGYNVAWIIDAESVVKNNDVYFYGELSVVDGGVLTVDYCTDFYIGYDPTVNYGLGANRAVLTVCEGGELIVRNSYVTGYTDDGWLFLVYGKLTVMDSTIQYMVELYLAPSSNAELSTSTIEYGYRNGIFVDNCSPIIRSCIIDYNEMDGIFIQGANAKPVIKSCLIYGNERGIYASECGLEKVVDNIILTNDLAGLYAEKVTGSIYDNVFLFNQKEIFLVDSNVAVRYNEIGYGRIMNSGSPYASLIMQVIMDMVDVNIDIGAFTGSLTAPSAVPGFDILGIILANLVMDDHIGLYAVDSVVVAENNEYGSLQYAVYALGSDICFSDVVKTNYFTISWYGESGTLYTYDLPFTVYDGIFADNSDVKVIDASIECMDDALFLEASTAEVRGTTFLAGDFDIFLMDGAECAVATSTLDKFAVEDTSKMFQEMLLTLTVKNQDGFGIAGAAVKVFDVDGREWASGTSDSKGVFKTYLPYSVITADGEVEHNQYTANATKGDVSGSAAFNMKNVDTSASVTLAIKNNSIFGMDPVVLGVIALVIVLVIVGALFFARKK